MDYSVDYPVAEVVEDTSSASEASSDEEQGSVSMPARADVEYSVEYNPDRPIDVATSDEEPENVEIVDTTSESEEEVEAESEIFSEKTHEIVALYRKHNPEKLPEVDGLVAKYGEAKLLSMVREKYLSAKRLEIDALYGKHNPEKLLEVDGLVVKYGEDKLHSMVRKKYRISEKRLEIEALYRANNPEKLPEVDGLIAKYGEDLLRSMVRKKYLGGGAAPEVTGSAAATALQQHIARHGVGDTKKINRLRRASMVPDSALPGRVFTMGNQPGRASGVVTNAYGDVDVTYYNAGPLGVVWRGAKVEGSAGQFGAFVKAVHPGSASSGVPQLQVGMQLQRVAGEAVAGKAYEEVRWTLASVSPPPPLVQSEVRAWRLKWPLRAR
jgi:hypothetical protein